MNGERADGAARDLAEAEARASALRAALDEARAATRAAEDKLRKRQTEEAEMLQAYGRAAERAKEVFAAERQRLEKARRVAEEGLRALDSMLQDFAGDAPRSADDLSGTVVTIEERLAALIPPNPSTQPLEDDLVQGDAPERPGWER